MMRFAAAACVALTVAAGCSEKDPSSLVVARVADREITVGDLEEASEKLEDRYLPATDDLEGRKELLDHIINKEVMALKALTMGYEKEEWFVQLWKQFEGPFLIAQLMEHEAIRKTSVTEEEIDRYFDNMHWEYTLSQIIVANEDEAMALRERAVAGEDFAELARTYSLGPGADQGGYVGSNTVGNIHWWVEEELFDMQPEDISMPLRTTAGFALIKLHSKRHVDPDRDREWAARRVKAIKDRKAMEALKARIEKAIELQFFTDAVSVAYDALPDDIPYEEILSYKITRQNAPKLGIPEQYRDMIIVQYVDGSYTLADFEEIYEATSLPERPRRQYGREHVMQLMHKVIFDKVLPVYAKETARLLENPEVKDIWDMRREQFLVYKLYENQVTDFVSVTDKDIREYYAEHLSELVVPEQRDFTVLVVADEAAARKVYEEARKTGADFSMLVRRHSEAEDVKENVGRTGLHK
ncbi:MAG: peptidyl-prolyl cis-trans isomerase, partial [Candidatus Krumholzibacteria bacterium]|nr:peptidyl-prolyl cis-trans isomerase [Candidatus Krumholzibacteria bacterium]